MKIITIQPSDKTGTQYRLTNEAGKTFELSTEVLFKRNLKPESEIDEGELLALMAEDARIKAKNQALRLLDFRMRTVAEVREKLAGQGFAKAVIADTITSLEDYGFLNDAEYARLYIKDKLASAGKHKLSYDLLNKGIDPATVKAALEGTDEDEELTACYNLAYKKYVTLKTREMDEGKLKEKVYRYLIGKGYSYDLIKQAYAAVIAKTNDEIDLT